jgi:adenylate cyclase
MAAGAGRGSLDGSEELRAITARLFQAAGRADLEAALARYSMRPGLTFWGTDVDEFVDDAELLVRYMRLAFQDDQIRFWGTAPHRIDAWVEGSVGWSVAHSRIEFDQGPRTLRSTLVFHLEHDEWKIVHQHASFGVSEEVYGYPEGSTLDLILAAAEDDRPDLARWTSDEGTTTLVFTDIEASTALNAAFGDRAWFEVLRAHNEIIERATEEHGGTVVKSQGDGFMLAFPSARRALSCGQTVQARIRAAFSDPGSPIRVRIGVHTGEVVSDSDDFFGHAVNYAARVAGAARGGEIVVSSLVHELTGPTGAFTFAPPRVVELKGIPDPVSVYPVIVPPQ